MSIIKRKTWSKILVFFSLAGTLTIFACSSPGAQTETNAMTQKVTFNDVHSYAKPGKAVVKHLNLDITVDFSSKTIGGKATYDIDNISGGSEIVLDSRDLVIEKVTLGEEETPTTFSLGKVDKYLGQPLSIVIKPETKRINIYYKTSPSAAALQWLAPEQTAGKVHPFLFTQSQAILARTWVPTQDGPGVRFTYEAKVKVPAELMALMSADNPQKKNPEGIYHFRMDQPIPSYLLALAVGDLEFKEIGPRTGVYAEPDTLDEAAYEFADMDSMLVAAEKLYGKYAWDRYDVIVLPPSFPFGGMENPRLTFATPTILAGDRSLVSLIAHELAHSWSGNLVTNATWDDFWLNEGFTVYFERRIMEALEGKEYAQMLEVLGYQDLVHEMKDLKLEDTKLKLNLAGRDPDEGLTNVAYEKGYFLLRYIEEQVGREKFDRFLNDYFSGFAFQVMTTERFLDHLQQELIQNDTLMLAEINRWIYEPGIPQSVIVANSTRFEQVNNTLKDWKEGTAANLLDTRDWSTHEWLHFIRQLPENISKEEMSKLDLAFDFTHSGNSEILAAWFDHAIKHDYSPAYDELANFLKRVGRRKFVLPLFKQMAKTEEGKKRALEIYREARPNYHAVTRGSVDDALGYSS